MWGLWFVIFIFVLWYSSFAILYSCHSLLIRNIRVIKNRPRLISQSRAEPLRGNKSAPAKASLPFNFLTGCAVRFSASQRTKRIRDEPPGVHSLLPAKFFLLSS